MRISSNLNEKKNEYILNVTNTSQDTVNSLKLIVKNKNSTIKNLTDLVEKLVIYRERGTLLFENLDTDLSIGNLYPNESAKLHFQLKTSVKMEEFPINLENVMELKTEKLNF